MNEQIVIVQAKRSAIGALCGGLSSVSAIEIGSQVATDLLKEIDISPEIIDEIISGQVLTAGTGQNPARQVALNIGMKDSSVALTINQVCGSGLRAVILGMQSILSGQSEIVLAGGQESMSNSPHIQQLRKPTKFGNVTSEDTIIVDGLQDAFDGVLMGVTAERLAEKFKITREEQDEFALKSQQKAQYAIENNLFSVEITPIKIPSKRAVNGEVVIDKDEHPRLNISLDNIAKMKPAFQKNGTVTAANASGLNDGAAYVLMMTAEKAKSLNLKPLVIIRSSGIAGVCPKTMGFGPVPASNKALDNANWNVNDLDLIESNEAFAAQSIAVNKNMGWDTDKVNVNGGAIALGHPIGASGARILVTLLYNMQRLEKQKGLATLCVGGGQGVAICVERA